MDYDSLTMIKKE